MVKIIAEWTGKSMQRFYVLSTEFAILPEVWLLWDATYVLEKMVPDKLKQWYIYSWCETIVWVTARQIAIRGK